MRWWLLHTNAESVQFGYVCSFATPSSTGCGERQPCADVGNATSSRRCRRWVAKFTQAKPSPLRVTSKIGGAWWDAADVDDNSSGNDDSLRAHALTAKQISGQARAIIKKYLAGIEAGALDIRTGADFTQRRNLDGRGIACWYCRPGSAGGIPGYVVGVKADIGSQSDRPLGTSDSIVARGVGFLRVPNAQTRWAMAGYSAYNSTQCA